MKKSYKPLSVILCVFACLCLFGFCAYSFGLFDDLFAKAPAEVPVIDEPTEDTPVFATALNANTGGFEVAVGAEVPFLFTTDGIEHISGDYTVTVADEAIATARLNEGTASAQGKTCGVVFVTGVATGETKMTIARADGRATLEVVVKVYDASYTVDEDGNITFTDANYTGEVGGHGNGTDDTGTNTPGAAPGFTPSDNPGGNLGTLDGGEGGGPRDPRISFG